MATEATARDVGSAVDPDAGAKPIEKLDAELASAADDLIAGEFEGEEEVLGTAVHPKTAAPVAPAEPAAPAHEPAPHPGEATADSAPPARPPEPEPESAPAGAPLEPLVVNTAPPEPPPSKPEPRSGDRSAEASTRPSPARQAPVDLPPPSSRRASGPGTGDAEVEAKPGLGALIAPALERAAGALSYPMRNATPAVRTGVGWLALVNIGLGMAVWVYILAIRSTVPPEPRPVVTAAMRAAAAEGSAAPAKKPGAPAKAPAKAQAKPAH